MSITVLDVTGLSCPLPVLRAKRVLKTVALNDVVRVLATDGGALKDVPVFCDQAGYELVSVSADENGIHVFDIKRIV